MPKSANHQPRFLSGTTAILRRMHPGQTRWLTPPGDLDIDKAAQYVRHLGHQLRACVHDSGRFADAKFSVFTCKETNEISVLRLQ